MLLTLTTTYNPATDLGYLLHKNPAKLHSFELSFGKAHVFYPEATTERCTAALLLDVDPVGLVRGKRGQHEGGTLDQYVNDRPYVLSSFLSVAMGRAFGTAMSGRSKGRQGLADLPIPLTANLTVVACRAGEGLIRELFEPLEYSVVAQQHPLDEKFPEWGEGPYYSVTLAGTFRLQDLLNHLYVLVPVLDAEKHYWIGQDEVEKLLRKGEGWLGSHPHKETIVKRYLPRQRQLAREALARLTEEDNLDPDATEEAHAEQETKMEEPIRLWQQRIGAVVAVLRSAEAPAGVCLGFGLRRRKTPAGAAGGEVVYRDRRHGCLLSKPRNCESTFETRPNAHEAKRTAETDARFADVSRQSLIRIRCCDGRGSNRTSRRATVGRIRASALRSSAPENDRCDHAQRGVQR